MRIMLVEDDADEMTRLDDDVIARSGATSDAWAEGRED